MYGLDYFKGFKVIRYTVITKSPKIHYCSACGTALYKRKVRLVGYKEGGFKKAFFCTNSKCWGEVKKLFYDPEENSSLENG